MEAKIFEFEISGEREWMAATSIVQAIKFYNTMVDISELDDDDNITEIPREDWGKLEVRNSEYDQNDPTENWEVKTFEEFVSEYSVTSLPIMIAGTCYD